jgi:hypothetical protein
MNALRIATIASVLLLTSRAMGQEVEPRGSADLNSVTVRPVLVETSGRTGLHWMSSGRPEMVAIFGRGGPCDTRC